MRKTDFPFGKTKPQIRTFIFATQILQYLYFLNPNFPAPSHLLSLHMPVCVRVVGNLKIGFLASRLIYYLWNRYNVCDLPVLLYFRGFRLGFNSLCAESSVNHQHIHAYYIDQELYSEWTVSTNKLNLMTCDLL